MSCFECVKCLTCCGLGCGVLSSVCKICKGVKAVKQEVMETIENKFEYKKLYLLLKEKDLYEDLQTGELVRIAFFKDQNQTDLKAS
jgi:hypothetical protein